MATLNNPYEYVSSVIKWNSNDRLSEDDIEDLPVNIMWATKMESARDTPKLCDDAMFNIFGRYLRKPQNEVRLLLHDYCISCAEHVESVGKEILQAMNIDVFTWLVGIKNGTRSGDELSLYFLCLMCNLHSMVYHKKGYWTTFVTTDLPTDLDRINASNLLFYYRGNTTVDETCPFLPLQDGVRVRKIERRLSRMDLAPWTKKKPVIPKKTGTNPSTKPIVAVPKATKRKADTPDKSQPKPKRIKTFTATSLAELERLICEKSARVDVSRDECEDHLQKMNNREKALQKARKVATDKHRSQSLLPPPPPLPRATASQRVTRGMVTSAKAPRRATRSASDLKKKVQVPRLISPLPALLEPGATTKRKEKAKRGNYKITCRLCGFKCKTDSEFEEHREKAHSEISKCAVCGKTFATKDTLRRHMYSHTRIKLICDKCGKEYTFQNELDVHKLTHGNKRFNCHVSGCDKSYVYKTDLSRHLAEHEQVREMVCSICGQYRTSKLKNLQAHERSHVASKKCKICGKLFNHSNQVTRHMTKEHSAQMGKK